MGYSRFLLPPCKTKAKTKRPPSFAPHLTHRISHCCAVCRLDIRFAPPRRSPAIWRTLRSFLGHGFQRVCCLRFIWPQKRRVGSSSPLVLPQEQLGYQDAAGPLVMFNQVSSPRAVRTVVAVHTVVFQHTASVEDWTKATIRFVFL